MTALAWLIPAALFLGGLGLAAFLWALRSSQFEDLEGAAYRAWEDEAPDAPMLKSTKGNGATRASGDGSTGRLPTESS
jgi:cbb3-type cytochrome oxidase maturation protein